MIKKQLWSVLAVAILTALMGSCSGSSGGGAGASTASTMTVTAGSSTTTYTDGPVNDAGYYDPSFSADCYPTPRTLITMCSGEAGGASGCTKLINVSAFGTTPGSYTVNVGGTAETGSPTYVSYSLNNSAQFYSSTSGTVTLTSVGNVGEPVTGSFEAVLALYGAPTTTLAVSGTFSVIRDH